MATAAQGAQQTDPDLDPTHHSPAASHPSLLQHIFIVGFIALANQQQVVIPAATLSTARAPDHSSLAGNNNSCSERVC